MGGIEPNPGPHFVMEEQSVDCNSNDSADDQHQTPGQPAELLEYWNDPMDDRIEMIEESKTSAMYGIHTHPIETFAPDETQ